MAAIVIRNISPETHQALQARAARHGRSTDDPRQRSPTEGANKVGTALAALVRPSGGLDLDTSRDATPAEPADLE